MTIKEIVDRHIMEFPDAETNVTQRLLFLTEVAKDATLHCVDLEREVDELRVENAMLSGAVT